MVKLIIITCLIFISIFITSCRYIILPHSYFNKYTKIISNNEPITTLDINKVYVLEDTMVTRTYHEYFGFEGKSYIYYFFYKNNLMAQILTPIIINSKVYPISMDDLPSYIKNGFFSKPELSNRIQWTYYVIDQNKLISYDYSMSSSVGYNTLNRPYLTNSKFIITNYGFINEEIFNSKKEIDTLNFNLFKPKPISIKPDSSKSKFIKMYNNYLNTGGRRNYANYKDFEKYINKK